jgi:hypothetical protein
MAPHPLPAGLQDISAYFRSIATGRTKKEAKARVDVINQEFCGKVHRKMPTSNWHIPLDPYPHHQLLQISYPGNPPCQQPTSWFENKMCILERYQAITYHTESSSNSAAWWTR